jgi:hypothetical protein
MKRDFVETPQIRLCMVNPGTIYFVSISKFGFCHKCFMFSSENHANDKIDRRQFIKLRRTFAEKLFFGFRLEKLFSIRLNRHENGISLPWQENRSRNF